MSDDQRPGSGNRWEPTGDTAPETTPPTQPEPETCPAAASAAAGPPTYEPPGTAASPARPTWWTRARAGVAGGAAAVLVAGGLGGFALGRATAEDGIDGRLGQNGAPTGFDRDGDGQGFQGGPGGPQLGPAPDGGQAPIGPGLDDGQQDGAAGSDT
jgi:hypothetical protein